jgi:hypothetical protein
MPNPRKSVKMAMTKLYQHIHSVGSHPLFLNALEFNSNGKHGYLISIPKKTERYYGFFKYVFVGSPNTESDKSYKYLSKDEIEQLKKKSKDKSMTLVGSSRNTTPMRSMTL